MAVLPVMREVLEPAPIGDAVEVVRRGGLVRRERRHLPGAQHGVERRPRAGVGERARRGGPATSGVGSARRWRRRRAARPRRRRPARALGSAAAPRGSIDIASASAGARGRRRRARAPRSRPPRPAPSAPPAASTVRSQRHDAGARRSRAPPRRPRRADARPRPCAWPPRRRRRQRQRRHLAVRLAHRRRGPPCAARPRTPPAWRGGRAC